VIAMDVVAERFIELVAIQHYRELNQEEMREFVESYKYLVKRQWEIAKIKKLIYFAYQTADGAWLTELYDRLQKIEKGGNHYE
jgi:hypothetical protein